MLDKSLTGILEYANRYNSATPYLIVYIALWHIEKYTPQKNFYKYMTVVITISYIPFTHHTVRCSTMSQCLSPMK